MALIIKPYIFLFAIYNYFIIRLNPASISKKGIRNEYDNLSKRLARRTDTQKPNVTQEKYFLHNEPAYSEVESQQIQVFSTKTLF